ncbi:MAG: ATPase [Patescibacteria group bacterium]
MTKQIYVINLAGEKEPLSLKKIYRSALRAGASKKLASQIAEIIKKKVYPGISTSEIFEKIKLLLRQEMPTAALRFGLKEALQKLGPSGFPFEKYIGAVLDKNGYQVYLNQIIPGRCVNYEIDFLAQKENQLYVGECKYHHLPGLRVDLKITLANYARFLDLTQGTYFHKKEFKGLKLKSILVTNTKFTTQAIQYSKCVGIELIGWRYPEDKGLEYLIESQKLYPITILPSLKSFLFDIFVSRQMMLVKDILTIDPYKFTQETGAPLKSILALIREAKMLQ